MTLSLSSQAMAQDGLKELYEKLITSVKETGKIDYKKSCPDCVKEEKRKSQLSKYDSRSNHQTIEMSVLSEEELINYFNEMAATKDIPFDYSADGCYARAHKMSRMLERRGVITGKAFVEGNLNVESPLMGRISWWYHVAPVVLVKKDGKEVPYVIDPSLFNKPIPFDEWRDFMTDGKKSNVQDEYFTNRFSFTPSDKYPPPKTNYNWTDIQNTQRTITSYGEKLKEIKKNEARKEVAL